MENKMTDEKQKPIHEIKFGAVRANIWRNESEKKKPFYSVSIGRLYKSGDDWKTSSSFGEKDFPLLKLAIEHAEAWLEENPIS